MTVETKIFSVLVSTFVMVGLVPVCCEGEPGKEILKVFGSDAIAAVVDEAASEFMGKDPSKTVVVTGGSTASGFRHLFDGLGQVTMSSGKVSPQVSDEAATKGIMLIGRVIGWADVPIVTNPDNPVQALTVDQVMGIFLGEHTSWREVGGANSPIVVMVTEEAGAGVAHFFREVFLRGTPVTDRAVKSPMFQAALVKVAWNKGAITFCRAMDIAQLERKGKAGTGKVLALKKDRDSSPVLPSPKLHPMRKGDYPIELPCYLYYDRNAKSLLPQAFVSFCAAFVAERYR